MENRTWMNPKIDRTTWGEGPWQGEPDKEQFVDPATGLVCLAVRHPSSGHWCGYVGIPKSHPFHGKDYSECRNVPACEEKYCGHTVASALSVHGGISFADKCSNEELGICHIVSPGEDDDIWWFGFDMAHSNDISPRYESKLQYMSLGAVYRDLAYVKSECAELAEQLAKIKEN